MEREEERASPGMQVQAADPAYEELPTSMLVHEQPVSAEEQTLLPYTEVLQSPATEPLDMNMGDACTDHAEEPSAKALDADDQAAAARS